MAAGLTKLIKLENQQRFKNTDIFMGGSNGRLLNRSLDFQVNKSGSSRLMDYSAAALNSQKNSEDQIG